MRTPILCHSMLGYAGCVFESKQPVISAAAGRTIAMQEAGRCESSLQELPALLLLVDWTCLLHCRGQGLADMSEYELDHLLQQSLADTPKQAGGCDVPAPNALRGARVSALEAACSDSHL